MSQQASEPRIFSQSVLGLFELGSPLFHSPGTMTPISPFFPPKVSLQHLLFISFQWEVLIFLETLPLSAFPCSATDIEIMQHYEMGTFLADFPFESDWRFMVILHSIKHLQVFRQSVLSYQWSSQAAGLACCQSRLTALCYRLTFPFGRFFSKQRKQRYKVVSVISKTTDQTNIIPVLFVKLFKFHQNYKTIIELLLTIEKS